MIGSAPNALTTTTLGPKSIQDKCINDCACPSLAMGITENGPDLMPAMHTVRPYKKLSRASSLGRDTRPCTRTYGTLCLPRSLQQHAPSRRSRLIVGAAYHNSHHRWVLPGLCTSIQRLHPEPA
jgi:hypothetical protein